MSSSTVRISLAPEDSSAAAQSCWARLTAHCCSKAASCALSWLFSSWSFETPRHISSFFRERACVALLRLSQQSLIFFRASLPQRKYILVPCLCFSALKIFNKPVMPVLGGWVPQQVQESLPSMATTRTGPVNLSLNLREAALEDFSASIHSVLMGRSAWICSLASSSAWAISSVDT